MKNKSRYKFIILYFFLFVIGVGGAQKREIQIEEIRQEPNVQKVLNIYKEIQVYKKNPRYVLHLSGGGFSCEILINDKLLYKNYRPKNVTGSIPLSFELLKSGKQRMQIRMYPKVNDDYTLKNIIEPRDVGLELSLERGEAQSRKPWVPILKYQLAPLSQPLPYYEINLEFEADLPYELKGWSTGVDLTKENQEDLLKEVEAYYKKVIHMYESGDVNALAGIYYQRQKEMGQALYDKEPGEYEFLIEEWTKDANRDQVFEFKDYELRFFGDGKMVALIKNSNSYRGYSALFSRNEQKGTIHGYDLFLYRPYPGAPLEVIR